MSISRSHSQKISGEKSTSNNKLDNEQYDTKRLAFIRQLIFQSEGEISKIIGIHKCENLFYIKFKHICYRNSQFLSNKEISLFNNGNILLSETKQYSFDEIRATNISNIVQNLCYFEKDVDKKWMKPEIIFLYKALPQITSTNIPPPLDDNFKYLVKWNNLGFDELSWELESSDLKQLYDSQIQDSTHYNQTSENTKNIFQNLEKFKPSKRIIKSSMPSDCLDTSPFSFFFSNAHLCQNSAFIIPNFQIHSFFISTIIKLIKTNSNSYGPILVIASECQLSQLFYQLSPNYHVLYDNMEIHNLISQLVLEPLHSSEQIHYFDIYLLPYSVFQKYYIHYSLFTWSTVFVTIPQNFNLTNLAFDNNARLCLILDHQIASNNEQYQIFQILNPQSSINAFSPELLTKNIWQSSLSSFNQYKSYEYQKLCSIFQTDTKTKISFFSFDEIIVESDPTIQQKSIIAKIISNIFPENNSFPVNLLFFQLRLISTHPFLYSCQSDFLISKSDKKRKSEYEIQKEALLQYSSKLITLSTILPHFLLDKEKKIVIVAELISCFHILTEFLEISNIPFEIITPMTSWNKQLFITSSTKINQKIDILILFDSSIVTAPYATQKIRLTTSGIFELGFLEEMNINIPSYINNLHLIFDQYFSSALSPSPVFSSGMVLNTHSQKEKFEQIITNLLTIGYSRTLEERTILEEIAYKEHDEKLKEILNVNFCDDISISDTISIYSYNYNENEIRQHVLLFEDAEDALILLQREYEEWPSLKFNLNIIQSYAILYEFVIFGFPKAKEFLLNIFNHYHINLPTLKKQNIFSIIESLLSYLKLSKAFIEQTYKVFSKTNNSYNCIKHVCIYPPKEWFKNQVYFYAKRPESSIKELFQIICNIGFPLDESKKINFAMIKKAYKDQFNSKTSEHFEEEIKSLYDLWQDKLSGTDSLKLEKELEEFGTRGSIYRFRSNVSNLDEIRQFYYDNSFSELQFLIPKTFVWENGPKWWNSLFDCKLIQQLSFYGQNFDTNQWILKEFSSYLSPAAVKEIRNNQDSFKAPSLVSELESLYKIKNRMNRALQCVRFSQKKKDLSVFNEERSHRVVTEEMTELPPCPCYVLPNLFILDWGHFDDKMDPYPTGFKSLRYSSDINDPLKKSYFISTVEKDQFGLFYKVLETGEIVKDINKTLKKNEQQTLSFMDECRSFMEKTKGKRVFSDRASSNAWSSVLKAVEVTKKEKGLPLRKTVSISGPNMYGFSEQFVYNVFNFMKK